MAETKIRLTDLDQLTDPKGAIGLVNKDGVDYKIPVEKFLLASPLLTDEERAIALAGLGGTNIDEVVEQINTLLREPSVQIQDLIVGFQKLAIVISEMPDNIRAVIDENVSVLSNKVSSYDKTIMSIYSGVIKLASSLADNNVLVSSHSDTIAEILKKNEQDRLNTLRSLHLDIPALAALEDVSSNAIDNLTSNRGKDFFTLPVPSDLIRIDLTLPKIPSKKDDPDVEGTVSILSDGAIYRGKVNCGVQGASSAAYPKKNLNIEFMNDDRSDNVKLALGDIMPLDTLTFKANWIDAMHVRNTMNYRIWEEIVKSRKGFPKYETDHSILSGEGIDTYFTGAKGCPMGYECVVFINGEFYGIGDLMSGKKRDSYNIPKNGPTQILLDNGVWYDLTKTYANAIDGTNAEIKAPKKVTDATKASLQSWDDFCVKFLAGDFTEEEFDERMDRTNLVDFIIFTQFMAANDTIASNTIKNTQTCTYDGKKWFFMPYDLDTCYGLHWNGGSVTATAPDTFNIFRGTFWVKVISTIGKETFLARWNELKDLNILTLDNVMNHVRAAQSKFGNDLFKQEQKKYPTVPSITIATTGQLVDWISKRMVYMDAFFK